MSAVTAPRIVSHLVNASWWLQHAAKHLREQAKLTPEVAPGLEELASHLDARSLEVSNTAELIRQERFGRGSRR